MVKYYVPMRMEGSSPPNWEVVFGYDISKFKGYNVDEVRVALNLTQLWLSQGPRGIVHGHDSRCDLSSKPINQKFFKLASSARATDLALKNILQPILLTDCSHFVLSLWYGPETRFVRGV